VPHVCTYFYITQRDANIPKEHIYETHMMCGHVAHPKIWWMYICLCRAKYDMCLCVQIMHVSLWCLLGSYTSTETTKSICGH